MKRKYIVVLIAMMLCASLAGGAAAQSNGPNAPNVVVTTEFMHQGQLKRNGSVNGGATSVQGWSDSSGVDVWGSQVAQAKPADGIVGDGTPASCTEDALNAALNDGGSVTFNCGALPVEIILSAQKNIAVDTQIDGGGLITLSGNGSRHFFVPAGAALTLHNLTLNNGFANGDGGSIFNQGTLLIDSATLQNNTTANNFSGGAIVNYGDLTIANSTLQNNTGGNGGAVYPRWSGSHTHIVNSVLRQNHAANATGRGGALLIWDGAVVVIEESQLIGNTAIEGGAIYNTVNSDITLRGSVLRENTASKWGGAIVNDQHLLIQNSTIADNTGQYQGGGIVNQGGAIEIESSTIAGNLLTGTDGMGGNIANWYRFIGGNDYRYGSLTLSDSTVTAGNAPYAGGGIFTYGPVTVMRSALLSNTTAGRGGAIFMDTGGNGSVMLENSTLADNHADNHGGALYKASGPLSIAFSTVAGNSAQQEGSNIYMDQGQPAATTTVIGTILADGDCVQNGLVSSGYNLDGGDSCGFNQATDLVNSDPLLDSLADNGGPTLTRLPRSNSPVINSIPDGCPALDQRGYPRPIGSGCDIGAVEFDGWQATATPFIVVMPNAVRAGSQLRVIGFHFERGKPYRFFLAGVDAALGDKVADTAGHFDLTLPVPDGFSPAGTEASLAVWSAFEPIEAVETRALAALPPLGLNLSTNNALPGTTITATVTNVAAGRLQVRYGSVVVAGPLTVGVGDGVVAVPFVVPLDGGQAPGAPVVVQVQNVVAGLELGTASALFTPRTPGSFDFNNQPNATVQAIPQSAPAWTGDQKVSVSGALPDVPADLRNRVKIDVMFRDQQGRSFPLLAQPLVLNANAQFNALVSLPSLFRGDPLPGSTPGSVEVSARLDDVVKLLPSNTIPLDQSPFGIKIVRRVDGPLDGTVIPDTPTGALRLIIQAEGSVMADSDALDSATFAEALTAAFKSVYSDQIGAAISSVVEKYIDCHPIIPQREVQPWEIAWRPSDEFQLLADQQSFALLNVGQLAQRLNVGRVPSLVAAGMAAQVQVRFILVTIDATEVKDVPTARNGYGPPESLKDGRKVAYKALYAVVPSTGKVFLVKGYDASHLLTPVSFELLPDGPVQIGLSPYPAGAKSRLEFDVTVPGLNILGVDNVQDPTLNQTVPVRTFGRLYSFANDPSLSIEGDALEIHMLVNEGAAYNQPPASAVSMNLYLNGGGNPIELPVVLKGLGTDHCKGGSKQHFVAKLKEPYKTLPPGRHTVEVRMEDGQTRLQRQLFLQVDAPPAWFLNGQYKNRRVVWSVSKTSVSADRYGAVDDTATPGDLQISPPPGAPLPEKLHVDNASGLDNRVMQILTPASPGAVTQSTGSRATAWNNTLGSAGVQSSADNLAFNPWPNPQSERSALTTPINNCTPGPFVQCIGPTHTGIPRKEMALFPPILWGIPPIADVKIAGSLAYEAGVDVTGMVRLKDDTPEVQVTVWPYARVSVAIDVAGEILAGLVGRLGVNTSGNVNVDVPVNFNTAGKSDLEACFRWFIHMRIYAQGLCVPFTNECAAEKTLDKRDLLDGREPSSQFCNGLKPLAAADASGGAATLDALPPNANPAIASDGVHMLALWNAPSNDLVYSVFDGNDWGSPQAIASGRIAERPAVVFYDVNHAVAVWNGSDLVDPASGLTLDQMLAHQVLEYALWDGVAWSAPARLAPASVRDGGAVLAGCMAVNPDCPASGEITAAWMHVASDALVDHQLRVYTASFVNGAWSVPQPVDPASVSADTAPMAAYAHGEPVVAWVRDSDRSFATADDRRIALRRMDSATVDVPMALPNQIVAGSMVADDAGQITFAFTRATDGALLSNHHELYAARETCQGTCVWTHAPLRDAQGRTLWGEHPVLTLDSHDRATISYRALGFGPNAQGVQVRAGDAPGITLGTGELAQVDLSASFAPASPRTLTHDGVLHWQPAAAYNATLNQIIALSVRGSGLVEARSADGSAVTLADTVLVAAAPRTPDFVLDQVTLLYAAPQDIMPQQVQVNVRNDGAAWTGGTPLDIAAAWDAPSLAARQSVTVSLPRLDAGQVASVTLTLPPLSGSPDADRVVFVTVNPRRTIDESNGANNDTQLPVTGVSGPAQVYLAADPRNRLLNLRWDAPTASVNVAGYRIYRRVPGGAWQSVGSSFVTGWADVNAQYDTLYEYAVSAYTAAGFESDLSRSMQAIMSAPLSEAVTAKIFLPLLLK